MSGARSAALPPDVYDLRSAWRLTLPQTGAPDDPTGTGAAAGDEEGQGDEIKDPDKKRLSDEAARHRVAAKTEKDRADAAEGQVKALTNVVRTARLEVAFYREATKRRPGFRDPAAAFKLADLAGCGVDEEGNVTGMDAVITKVAEDYPYVLADDSHGDATDEPVMGFPALGSSGAPMNRAKKPGTGLDRAALAGKFPALRQRR